MVGKASLVLLIALLSSGMSARLAPLSEATPLRLKRQAAVGSVAYTLQPDLDTGTPRLKITMTFVVPEGASRVAVQMPVWSPGDYSVQNFARYVQDLRVAGVTEKGDAVELPFTHGDANTWEVSSEGAKQLTVTYFLPDEASGNFSSNVKFQPQFIFVNGASAFLYLVGHKELPTRLEVTPPTGWQTEISLPVTQEPDGIAAYSASDYDTLADSPLLLAAPQAIRTAQFTVGGKPHRIVFFDHPEPLDNIPAYTTLAKAIVEAEVGLMKSQPYSQYILFLDVNGVGDGNGLEHLNSCRIGLDAAEPPRYFTPLFAHEFFHLWNVKRIRPRVLGPFDYVHPPQTRNLWFAEGVTDYFAYLAALRAGLITPADYLAHWRAAIKRLQENPARKHVTAEEASLRVWETAHSEGYGGLSYYEKGALIGLCLDLTLRHATEGQRSLLDVMQRLYQHYAPPQPGYEEDALVKVVSEVAGQDLKPLYDRLARSTEEMPFADCLAYVGLDAQLRALPKADPAALALRNAWLAKANGPEGKMDPAVGVKP